MSLSEQLMKAIVSCAPPPCPLPKTWTTSRESSIGRSEKHKSLSAVREGWVLAWNEKTALKNTIQSLGKMYGRNSADVNLLDVFTAYFLMRNDEEMLEWRPYLLCCRA